MVKIAHISTTFNNASVYKWTRSLAQDQKNHGWDVEFIVGHNADHVLVQQAIAEGVPVNSIPSLHKYPNPYYDFRALCDLTNLLKRKKIHLVHTYLAKAGIIGRLAAKMAGTKIILHSVYGSTFAPTMPLAKQVLFESMEKLAALVSDRLVFVGQELRDAYVSRGICAPHKCSVIYNSFDFSSFITAGKIPEPERQNRRRMLGLNEKNIILGNVSRLVPWKGHRYALALIKALKAEFPKIKLIIVGDAVLPSEETYREELFQLVKELGIGNEVIFTGWQKDPSFYYSLFDIYLLTSMPLEGVPGVIMEATCAGVPVIGFECTGVREVVGEQALLVPPKDLTALTGAVRGAIPRLPEIRCQFRKDPTELEALQKRHSPVRMVKEYRQLYQTLLAV